MSKIEVVSQIQGSFKVGTLYLLKIQLKTRKHFLFVPSCRSHGSIVSTAAKANGNFDLFWKVRCHSVNGGPWKCCVTQKDGHKSQFNIEVNIWQYIKDTRTLRRQELWSCSLHCLMLHLCSQCVWAEGQSRQWADAFASITIGIISEQNICFRSWSQGGGSGGEIKGQEKKHACRLQSTSTAFTRYSDWCSLCTSAVGATAGFHAQRPKQQTAASGNTVIQVQNSLCRLLLASPHATLSLNLATFFHLYTPSSSNPLFMKCWEQHLI